MTIDISMWDEPSEQITAAKTREIQTLASAAVEPMWGYLSHATNQTEFDARLAVARPGIERLVAATVPSDQVEGAISSAAQGLASRWAEHRATVDTAARLEAALKVSVEDKAGLRVKDSSGKVWVSDGWGDAKNEGGKWVGIPDSIRLYDEENVSNQKTITKGDIESGKFTVVSAKTADRQVVYEGQSHDWHEDGDGPDKQTLEPLIGKRVVIVFFNEHGVAADHEIGRILDVTEGRVSPLIEWEAEGGTHAYPIEADQIYKITRIEEEPAQHEMLFASKTAGYAIVSPKGEHLWGMVYDTEEGAKAHHDEVKNRTDDLVPRGLKDYKVQKVDKAPNRTYDKSNPRNPFQPHGSKTAADSIQCVQCALHGMFYCQETVDTCDLCGQRKDVFRYRPEGQTPETVCLDCLCDGKHMDSAHVPGWQDPRTASKTAKWIDQARAVVDNKGYRNVDPGTSEQVGDNKGVILDHFTASMLVQIYDALSPENKAKFDAMPLSKAVDVGWKLVNKTRASKTAETHAPYKIEQRGDKWVVVNSIDEVKGTHDSKEEAREQQKALYANVPGASEQAEKKSSKQASPNWLKEYFSEWSEDHPGKKQCTFSDTEGRCQRVKGHEGDHAPLSPAKAAARVDRLFTEASKTANGPTLKPDFGGSAYCWYGPGGYYGDLAEEVGWCDGPIYWVEGESPRSAICTKHARDKGWLDKTASKTAAEGPLPEHLQQYWGNRTDDPRDKPAFCAKQSRKTPAIPWHNGDPCLACGKTREQWAKTSAKSDICPKCKAHMTDVTVQGDTLRAKCDNCGWSGTKRKKTSAVEDLLRFEADRTGPTIDSAEGYEYTPAPEWVQRACRKRFEGGITAMDPDHPGHYLHGVGNWWDGPSQVKDNGDGTLSYTNPYTGETDRFDEHGYYKRDGTYVRRGQASRHEAAAYEYECTKCHHREHKDAPGPCSNCGAPTHEHRIVGFKRSAVADLLAFTASLGAEALQEVEAAFFHYPEPPNRTTSAPGPRSVAHPDPEVARRRSYGEPEDGQQQAEQREAVRRTAGFWEEIEAQLAEVARDGKTADDVIRILNKYGPPSSGDAFFAGSGGDDSLMDALYTAGWTLVWAEASYYYVMRAPNGDLLTYVEGDVMKGDQSIRQGSSRQAVNENAYGTERYQKQPEVRRPDWITEWSDEETRLTKKEREQGLHSHQPENPFKDTLTTIRQSARRHMALDVDDKMEGFEQSSDFDDFGQGGGTAYTTRPRVKPHRTPEITNPPVSQPAGGNGSFDADPTLVPNGDFGMDTATMQMADPMQPTMDQMVAAKIARLAKRVRIDNPTMSLEEARHLAARTVERYPEMVRQEA